MLRRLQAFGMSARPLILGAIVAYALTEMRSMLTEYAEELTIKTLAIDDANMRVAELEESIRTHSDVLRKLNDRHQNDILPPITDEDRYQLADDQPHAGKGNYEVPKSLEVEF